MTERTAPASFMGIKISGDTRISDARTAQRPDEEFQQALKAMLDDPEIHDFGWEQYTPYFNDGDPCVFGALGFWVRTVEDVDSDGGEDFSTWDYEHGWNHPTLGTKKWDGSTLVERESSNDERFAVTRQRVDDFAKAVEGGGHYDLLYNTFGDHKEIQVSREGIVLHHYEHD